MKLKLFVFSLLGTMALLLTVFLINHALEPKSTLPNLVQVAPRLSITSQLRPENLRALRAAGFTAIVDVRPDGEAADQPSSSEIERASRRYGVDFHYIPVPHESIPAGAVEELGEVLFPQPEPTVLYCRTGRRAVRLLALAQASRFDGPQADAIVDMVKRAGFSADDLHDEIAKRILQRHVPVEDIR